MNETEFKLYFAWNVIFVMFMAILGLVFVTNIRETISPILFYVFTISVLLVFIIVFGVYYFVLLSTKIHYARTKVDLSPITRTLAKKAKKRR